jgi:hypothetical protein
MGHAQAHLRFCLDCGVRRGIYAPGVVLRCFEAPDMVVCVRCGCLGSAAKPPRIHAKDSSRGDGLVSLGSRRSEEEDEEELGLARKDGGEAVVGEGPVGVEVKGLCEECAARTTRAVAASSKDLLSDRDREQAQSQNQQPKTTPPPSKIVTRNQTQIESHIDQHPTGTSTIPRFRIAAQLSLPGIPTPTTQRKTRCQRCWAIDHTERPVAGGMQGGELLCWECFVEQSGGLDWIGG